MSDKLQNTFYVYAFDVNNNMIPVEAVEYGNSDFVALYGTGLNLARLTIPESITHVFCNGNRLSDLKLTSNIKRLQCDKDLFDYDECKILNVHICY